MLDKKELFKVSYDGLFSYNNKRYEFSVFNSKGDSTYLLIYGEIGLEDTKRLEFIASNQYHVSYQIAAIVRSYIDDFFMRNYKEDYGLLLTDTDSKYHELAKTIKANYDAFCNELLTSVLLFEDDGGEPVTISECIKAIYNNASQYLFITNEMVTTAKGKVRYSIYARHNPSEENSLVECFVSEAFNSGDSDIDSYDFTSETDNPLKSGYSKLFNESIVDNKKYKAISNPSNFGFLSPYRLNDILDRNKKDIGFYIEVANQITLETVPSNGEIVVRLIGTPFKLNACQHKSVTITSDIQDFFINMVSLLSDFNDLELDYLYDKVLGNISVCNSLKNI